MIKIFKVQKEYHSKNTNEAVYEEMAYALMDKDINEFLAGKKFISLTVREESFQQEDYYHNPSHGVNLIGVLNYSD